ncbi:uncharacterized protein LOC135145742 [Zophobas morio]|uniref:uncharacterized protein LOC135145742 n=1 Tax=Zophobas morio TaxID=2755281 RepID=UPI003082A1D1
MRCYPIPFTLEEALSIGSEFDLFFSECFDPSKLPIIDSIQVYGIPARELQTLNTKFFDSGKFTSLEQFCSECCALFSHLYFSSSRAETQYQEDGQWNIIESTIAQLLMKGVPVYVEKILKSTLKTICPLKSAYHNVKDKHVMQKLCGIISSSASNFTEIAEQFIDGLSSLVKISAKRLAEVNCLISSESLHDILVKLSTNEGKISLEDFPFLCFAEKVISFFMTHTSKFPVALKIKAIGLFVPFLFRLVITLPLLLDGIGPVVNMWVADWLFRFLSNEQLCAEFVEATRNYLTSLSIKDLNVFRHLFPTISSSSTKLEALARLFQEQFITCLLNHRTNSSRLNPTRHSSAFQPQLLGFYQVVYQLLKNYGDVFLRFGESHAQPPCLLPCLYDFCTSDLKEPFRDTNNCELYYKLTLLEFLFVPAFGDPFVKKGHCPEEDRNSRALSSVTVKEKPVKTSDSSKESFSVDMHAVWSGRRYTLYRLFSLPQFNSFVDIRCCQMTYLQQSLHYLFHWLKTATLGWLKTYQSSVASIMQADMFSVSLLANTVVSGQSGDSGIFPIEQVVEVNTLPLPGRAALRLAPFFFYRVSEEPANCFERFHEFFLMRLLSLSHRLFQWLGESADVPEIVQSCAFNTCDPYGVFFENSEVVKREWIQIFCRVLDDKHCSNLHSIATLFFRAVCPSNHEYYWERDTFCYAKHLHYLYKHQSDYENSSYESVASLSNIFNELNERAQLRPHNWRMFILNLYGHAVVRNNSEADDSSIIIGNKCLLVTLLPSLCDDVKLTLMKIIERCLCTTTNVQTERESENLQRNSTEERNENSALLKWFSQSLGNKSTKKFSENPFLELLLDFVLHSPMADIRKHALRLAQCFLMNVNIIFQQSFFTYLLKIWHEVFGFSCFSNELTELVIWCLRFFRNINNEFIQKLSTCFEKFNNFYIKHSNAYIYSSLQESFILSVF